MSAGAPVRWGKVIDQTRCIGCHACSTACKSENLVPLSVHRTFVKSVDVGIFPNTRRAFQVTRCNQCADAPCATACPTRAMHKRPDGIVDFDKDICIGCKACIAACPYDAIFINPEDHSAEKCNFCAHRIDGGLEPACVSVCPTNAILIGDLDDPESEVARIVGRDVTAVRRPEKETHPKLFYKGAHQATLDPLAARRPEGGIFAWSEQPDHIEVASPNSQAAAIISYDVAHRVPWDWRVSLYTFTKNISAGVYLVGFLLIITEVLKPRSLLWLWGVPILSGAFLAITGLLLIFDLEHPLRFYMIFTKRQWRSWLVRGAFIITGFAAALAAHYWAAKKDEELTIFVSFAGAPLALMTSIYTAYLFAQAKGRDLWQNPQLPPHLFVQSVLAGSATLALANMWRPKLVDKHDDPLVIFLIIACVLHLLLVLGEVTMAHPTAHARAAARNMIRGPYAVYFWFGIALVFFGLFTPAFGPACAIAALVGLLFHEHAYVQSGQSVPLA